MTKSRKTGNLVNAIGSNVTSRSPSSNGLVIGRLNGTNGFFFVGNIYNTQIYNRALSAQEVLQNYNAAKGRFGL
jgi:hypothetical protein